MFFGKPLKNMSPREVSVGLEQGDVVLIDVRENHEYAAAHIPGSKHIPLSSFNVASLPKVDANKTIVFQCQSGMRSAQAAKIAQKAGIENVANLSGGIMGWSQSGLPIKSGR